MKKVLIAGATGAMGQKAAETWCDIVEGLDATHYATVFDRIEIARDNTSSTSRLKELTLEQWFSFLIPFPREWA